MLGQCKDECVCDNFPDVPMCSDNGNNGNNGNGRRRRSLWKSLNVTDGDGEGML